MLKVKGLIYGHFSSFFLGSGNSIFVLVNKFCVYLITVAELYTCCLMCMGFHRSFAMFILSKCLFAVVNSGHYIWTCVLCIMVKVPIACDVVA